MKNIILKKSFLVLYLLLFTFSKAQEITFEKSNFDDEKKTFQEAIQSIKEGDSYFNKKNYEKALKAYMFANDFNDKSSELNAKIGETYFHLGENTKAIDNLSKALFLNKSLDAHYVILLGKAYQRNYEFDEAIKIFKQARTKPNKINPEATKELKKLTEDCTFAKQLKEKPVKVLIENLGENINTEYEEYVPVINADESILMFTSRRPNTTGFKKDPIINDYFEDIYVAERSADGKYNEARNIGEPINTTTHDATVALSVDGQSLFIYRDTKKGKGDIFISRLSGKTWLEPEKLPEPINSPFQETSACFSPDGNIIFFVSEREGGLGGKDIYYSIKQKDGNWGAAKNIGKPINTPFDEDAVFLHPDGKTLYFSSDGHKGMGGLDIFKSTINPKTLKGSQPENIGYPINSPDKDVCFVTTADGKYAYYVSIRPEGKGKRDIYRITFLDEKEEKDKPKLTLLKGMVMDKITQDPIEADIEIFDNEKIEKISSFKSNSKTGKYMLSLTAGRNYGINVKADGYLFHSENFLIPDSAAFQEVTKDVKLQKIDVGTKVILNNIFYDYNQATLRPASFSELDEVVKLLNKFPKMSIEIASHTDSRGTDEYNNKLSQDRAQACVDYLIKKGVARSRLQAKGYGKQQLLILDEIINKAKTNEEKEALHQQNRRTEFKIIAN